MRVKKIEVVCESHDQGWSSYPENHGTYHGSWTWGDCNVLDADGNEKGARQLAYTNLHARSDWQRHTKVFEEGEPLVKEISLERGDSVGLWIRACFPGWCNYVRFARIKLFYCIQ